jgi:predicted pyridoxine 5'-phosphate oxidase superfamily flavin-nucleotide-binding protein
MKAIESNNKWYFRNTDTLGDDDDIATSIMLPVDQITGIVPGNVTTRIRIHFEQPTAIAAAEDATGNGFIQLNTTAGRQKEVLQFLAEAANSSTQHTGFQTIVDEYTGEKAFKYITGVAAIVNK